MNNEAPKVPIDLWEYPKRNANACMQTSQDPFKEDILMDTQIARGSAHDLDDVGRHHKSVSNSICKIWTARKDCERQWPAIPIKLIPGYHDKKRNGAVIFTPNDPSIKGAAENFVEILKKSVNA